MPRFQRKRFQRRRRFGRQKFGRRRKGGLTGLIKSVVTKKLCRKNAQTYKSTFQMYPAINVCKYTAAEAINTSAHLYQLLNNIVGTFNAANIGTRFYVNNVSQHINFTNQDLGNSIVTAYYCIARRDVPNIAAINTPINILTKGFDQAGSVSGGISGATAITEITLTPFDCPLFCKYYKIYKVKKLILAPGETHNLKLSSSRNFKVDGNMILPDDAALTSTDVKQVHWAHRTKFILFRVEGQATNDATTTTSVGTTTVKVDFVVNTKYNYTWISDTTNDLYAVQGSYSSMPAGAKLVTDAATQTDAEA